MSGSLFGATTPKGGGGGESPWSAAAGVLFPQSFATDDVVIGANSMIGAERFRVNGDSYFDATISLPNTTAVDIGVVRKGGNRFIHDFQPPAVTGRNLFVGEGSGNYTMSSVNAYECSFLVGVGVNTLQSITTGYSCTAIGDSVLLFNTTGSGFVGIGQEAFVNIDSGNNSIAIGPFAGVETPGAVPVTFASRCIYIGNSTRPSSAFPVDEIVIAPGGQGAGNNTLTIGSTNINDSYLYGNLRLENGMSYYAGAAQGLSGVYTFGGGGSGDVATMTFTGGILTGVTTVP